MTRSGGQLLTESLLNLGAKQSFGVPGESYLAVLDALHDVQDRHRFVICRNEGGAAFMAAAYGKLTGTPGICFVTRGPGASNASIGVHTAAQDSAPMLLFIGQVGTSMLEREAFQEVDYRAMYGSIAKWVTQIDQADRIPELVARAWKTALSGRPGPVVVALPEDMLRSLSSVEPASAGFPLAQPAVDETTLEAVYRQLAAARRPVILYGGCNWTVEGMAALQQFAEQSDIPVVSTFRYNDQFDNHSRVYCGETGVGMLPYMKKMLSTADLILAINVRFGEISTDGYTLLEVPEPSASLLHVHASCDEIGKIYRPQLGIQCGPNQFAQSLAPVDGVWKGWCSQWREEFLGYFETVPDQQSPVDMKQVCAYLRKNLPEDVIVTNGAGNFAAWSGKFLQYGRSARLLAPQSGAMGYGLPAAIAAKLQYPQRTVLCFAGDGDFQMNCQELATAAQYDARPIILVVNNGVYGTIRAHQETHYPDRVFGTSMFNPDFTMLARAYGLHAERVERTEAFADAFGRASASETGALLDLCVSAEAISPFKRIADLQTR
jgi:acetolactate synthase-1/2/3 large subunit